MFRDGRCRERSTNAQKRRLIGSRYKNHCTPQSFFAEDFEKLADFAAAFADQRQHRHIGAQFRAPSCQCSVLLPTPLPPKMPIRWPRPQVTKSVDGANAATERLTNRNTIERQRRGPIQGHRMDRAIFAFAVERIARGIDDASEHAGPDAD